MECADLLPNAAFCGEWLSSVCEWLDPFRHILSCKWQELPKPQTLLIYKAANDQNETNPEEDTFC